VPTAPAPAKNFRLRKGDFALKCPFTWAERVHRERWTFRFSTEPNSKREDFQRKLESSIGRGNLQGHRHRVGQVRGVAVP